MAHDYAGATGRLTLSAARELGGGWMLQPKRDGAYATVLLDGAGQVAEVRSRSGRVVPRTVHRLTGERVGEPYSVLCGELESHTEAGVRAAAARAGGLPMIHLFDAIQVGRERVTELPYRERRDRLYRAWVACAERDDGRDWARDRVGLAHGEGGQFVTPIEHGWRRCEVVPQAPVARVEEVWADWVERVGGEGLVAVRQDARLGARACKRKIKPERDVEMVVVAADRGGVMCYWAHAGHHVAVAPRAGIAVAVGDVVTVRHSGFYDSGVPKFARLERVRADLM